MKTTRYKFEQTVQSATAKTKDSAAFENGFTYFAQLMDYPPPTSHRPSSSAPDGS